MSEEEEFEFEGVEKRQRTGDLLDGAADLLDGFDDFLKSPDEEESVFGFVDTAATSSSSLLDEPTPAVSVTESLNSELRGLETRYGITTSVEDGDGEVIVSCIFSTMKFLFYLSSRLDYENGSSPGAENDEFDFLASFTGGGSGLLSCDVEGEGKGLLDGLSVQEMRISEVVEAVRAGI